MDRVFESGASGTPPSEPASPSTGYPTAGNPSLAIPATKPGPWWYHMMTEELRAVIDGAGLTPDHTVLTQLRDALITDKSIATSGYLQLGPLFGGLTIQWGSASNTPGSPTVVSFPIEFPTECFGVLLTRTDYTVPAPGEVPFVSGPPTATEFNLDNDPDTAGLTVFWWALGH